MKLSWLFPVETGLTDLAVLGVMVSWIRRRNRQYLLQNLDAGTATPIADDVLANLSGADNASDSSLKRARLVHGALKRFANTKAAEYLCIAAFNKDSFLNQEGRSFFRMLSNRSEKEDEL